MHMDICSWNACRLDCYTMLGNRHLFLNKTGHFFGAQRIIPACNMRNVTMYDSAN